MSTFSFGFQGDNIELEADEAEAVDTDNRVTQNDQGRGDAPPELRPAKLHSLEEMLSSLPSHISYSHLDIPLPSKNALHLSRRELFDVRLQIMAETDDDGHEPILDDLDKGDLRPLIYEGGFKTWECAIDLAKIVAVEELDWLLGREDGGAVHVIELGSGTAIPSLAIYQSLLHRPEVAPTRRTQFTICDYNDIVLRLVSMPNVLITAQESLHSTEVKLSWEEDGELDLEEKLLKGFAKSMTERHIGIRFVSGGWGTDFVRVVNGTSQDDSGKSAKKTLILASETIYSPASMKSFVQTLLELLRQGVQGAGDAKALVAAKRVYFGVGGGVDEFVEHVRREGGSVRERLDVSDGGVSRVVLEITCLAS